jgi:hypothetical protein
MRSSAIAVVVCISVLSLASVSCTTGPARRSAIAAPPAEVAGAAGLAAAYAELAKSGGRVYRLDPDASEVRIFVFRGGRAARLGHNHILSAPRFAGFFMLPEAGPTHARFDLAFRLDQLQIDDPAVIRKVGGGFASTLSPGALAAMREHMLGDDNLQADKYPDVRVRSLRIVGESPAFAAEVEIEMHGRKRVFWLPLTVEGLPERLMVDGAFVLRQTDFGAAPYSALGGLLAVEDEVVVRFRLVGQ